MIGMIPSNIIVTRDGEKAGVTITDSSGEVRNIISRTQNAAEAKRLVSLINEALKRGYKIRVVEGKLPNV